VFAFSHLQKPEKTVKMQRLQTLPLNYPTNYPLKMNGNLSYKITIKDEYVRHDGTCALYVQVFINKQRKKFPLNLSVPPMLFDKQKQRVLPKHPYHKDYNLIIEKFLAEINTIEINYRLSGSFLDIEKLTNEILNPTSWICFITFWDEEMKRQKTILKPGTYRQQKSALEKLREFKTTIYFYEINKQLIDDITVYLKAVKKNEENTIATFFKNFKKYLNIAIEKGIRINLGNNDIKRANFKSNRTFLMPNEITKMYKYWESDFINQTHKSICARFLFSCFTGLRISDIMALNDENILGDYLVFISQKTGKLQRIQLNQSAQKFINTTTIFEGNYTAEYINRTLKDICKICGIKKHVSYHVSRHTFATNFLISGGNVTVLQKLLGHSKIEDTMIYVHIAESITDIQILNMDSIISNSQNSIP
jgi:integrase/recombinase XerD